MNESPLPPQEHKTEPKIALEQIQTKINSLAQEYSAGKLNRAQFYAMYRHYMEKRTIIQRLLERDPETEAWKAAAAQGATSFLRDRYEARTLYYVIFRKDETRPLLNEGKLPVKAAEQVHKMLQVIWNMKQWRKGLARKSLGDGVWLLLMMGDNAMTMVIYFLQPSTLQVNELRDLHNDFERANRNLLERGAAADRMVFPQRTLMRQQ